MQQPAQPLLIRVRSPIRFSRWSISSAISRSGPARRAREIRFADRRPGDGQRVDRVALAARPRGLAGAGHQLRRDPDHRLAGASSRSSAAKRAGSPRSPTRARASSARESQQPEMTVLVAAHRDVVELSARDLLDRRRRLRALVRVDADNDHAVSLRCCDRTAGGQHFVQAQASLLSGHAGDPGTRRVTEPR